MNAILDACTAINLVNGEALTAVIATPGLQFFIGPQSLDECGDLKPVLEALIRSNQLTLLEDTDLSSSLFLELLERFSLGDGETETLTFSQMFGYEVCTDDKKARQTATQIFGADRVTGSLGLLKRAVLHGLFAPDEAYSRYKKMKAAGAFLPDIPDTYFNDNLGTA